MQTTLSRLSTATPLTLFIFSVLIIIPITAHADLTFQRLFDYLLPTPVQVPTPAKSPTSIPQPKIFQGLPFTPENSFEAACKEEASLGGGYYSWAQFDDCLIRERPLHPERIFENHLFTPKNAIDAWCKEDASLGGGYYSRGQLSDCLERGGSQTPDPPYSYSPPAYSPPATEPDDALQPIPPAQAPKSPKGTQVYTYNENDGVDEPVLQNADYIPVYDTGGFTQVSGFSTGDDNFSSDVTSVDLTPQQYWDTQGESFSNAAGAYVQNTEVPWMGGSIFNVNYYPDQNYNYFPSDNSGGDSGSIQTESYTPTIPLDWGSLQFNDNFSTNIFNAFLGL